MARESHSEVVVGSFVVAALVALGIVIFSVSDFSNFEEGKRLKIIFGFANGLKKSAPVRFAGVDAGIIKDITIFFDKKDAKTKVAVDCWLKSGIEIPIDSQVAINQLGLLGEKYIEIIPGLSTDEFHSDGDQLIGKDPIAVEKLTEMISEVAQKADLTLAGINDVVQNETNKKSLQDTLQGLSLIVTNIKDGHGTVGRFLVDETIYNNLSDFTSDLKANPWKLLYRPKAKDFER